MQIQIHYDVLFQDKQQCVVQEELYEVNHSTNSNKKINHIFKVILITFHTELHIVQPLGSVLVHHFVVRLTHHQAVQHQMTLTLLCSSRKIQCLVCHRIQHNINNYLLSEFVSRLVNNQPPSTNTSNGQFLFSPSTTTAADFPRPQQQTENNESMVQIKYIDFN